jgi:hypothetical protein
LENPIIVQTMTHLCYTLEETADRLNLSETVLVRLSQYFKVPKSAYEDIGYLSFKGDLAFSDQDIAFLRQVKERLLAGENLEEVKGRMRIEPLEALPLRQPDSAAIQHATHASAANDATANAISAPESTTTVAIPAALATAAIPAALQESSLPPMTAGDGNPEPYSSRQERPQAALHPASTTSHENAPVPSDAPTPSSSLPTGMEGLLEVENSQSFQKAAEQSFERYKSQHRTGIGKIFEKMLKDVGNTASKQKATLAGLRSSRSHVGTHPNLTEKKRHGKASVSEHPFSGAAEPDLANNPFAAGEFDWEAIISQATHQPRVLNSQLKNAALLLRKNALQQTEPPQNRLG